MAVRKGKIDELNKQLEELNLSNNQFEEKFIHPSTKGGQKANKTSNAVFLKHLPTGITVKCNEDRSREVNRFKAKRLFLEKYRQIILNLKPKRKKINKKKKLKKNKKKFTPMDIIILGASPDPKKYSNKVLTALKKKGHNVICVNPKYNEIEGLKCYPDLKSIENCDAISIHVNPHILTTYINDIINCKPSQVIFNPQTELLSAINKCEKNSIKIIECPTLDLIKKNML